MINSIHPSFLTLPQDYQQKKLELIKEVNEKHLHCDESLPHWGTFTLLATEEFAKQYFQKNNKIQASTAGMANNLQPAAKQRMDFITGITGSGYAGYYFLLKKDLEEIFHDPSFTDPILEAAHKYIMGPHKQNVELLKLLVKWIRINAKYLPIGEHLLPAFKKDMEKESVFVRHELKFKNIVWVEEAKSDQVFKAMRAFLASAAAANDRCLGKLTINRNKTPTVVILDVKYGAGGHSAPHNAMEVRLQELGYKVERIYFDTDLGLNYDPFIRLGITFEDDSPMTADSKLTRWDAQKYNQKVSNLVSFYANTQKSFRDKTGTELIEKIAPLNPSLFITSCAYSWVWKALAYRWPLAKTILIASDVFMHYEPMSVWQRQLDLPTELRNVHFTTMTDDLELLNLSVVHDEYFSKKYPNDPLESWKEWFAPLKIDEQITVTGAIINPSFNVESDPAQIKEKWEVPDGVEVICISRGRLGNDVDLEEALEGYQTNIPFSKPIHLHVVCGENDRFYERLQNREYDNLAPNISIVPHRKLDLKEMAEIRSISLIDDIKAGGASTFEGWYLISNGSKTRLLLTPGNDLWWELVNCRAMEKWGVGTTVKDNKNKKELVEEVLQKGIQPISHHFPDWKKPFDQLIKTLIKA